MEWQLVLSLSLLASASGYLVWRGWRTWRARASCGGCGSQRACAPVASEAASALIPAEQLQMRPLRRG